MNKNQKKELLNTFGGAAGAFLVGIGSGADSVFIATIGMILFIPSSIDMGRIIERRRWTE
ncbi:MAG: hypothetical protein ACOCT9_00115 [archaeon]